MWRADAIPTPVLAIFRGLGQVFFQENALTGAFFALGIAVNSPKMALAAIIGSAIGWATARLLKFDEAETTAGIYGFNAVLVAIAMLLFFELNVASVVLLIVGCILSALITWLARRYLPFPTYTAPFIVTTWLLYLVGPSVGATLLDLGGPGRALGPIETVAKGIGQVMFQGSVWTGLLFLIGIGLNNWQHAIWVVVASALGALVAKYHVIPPMGALDAERVVDRLITEKIGFGLYGYNATLTAIALFLWRRSLIPVLLGIVLSVPLTDLFPRLGLPALTAPFVLAAWIVLAVGWLETRLFPDERSPTS